MIYINAGCTLYGGMSENDGTDPAAQADLAPVWTATFFSSIWVTQPNPNRRHNPVAQ
jgi:hypothetical protein